MRMECAATQGRSELWSSSLSRLRCDTQCAGLSQPSQHPQLAKRRCLAQDIVTEITRKQPGYRPPPDLRLAKRQRKIFVPVREHPHYNFIGLIIGPRGNTQKRMQQESGAKIALRGRGSVKDGRAGRAGLADPADNEDLHVLITADTENSLNKVHFTQWLVAELWSAGSC